MRYSQTLLILLLSTLTSCQYSREELTGTWKSGNELIQINDSVILRYEFPGEFRIYSYDIMGSRLRMSLSSFTTEVARSHSALKIDALDEDNLWSNGRQWVRVSQDTPILYFSNANRWKVFYEWQIDELGIYPPPPPDSDETIGFTCNMDIPTPPVLRTRDALRKLDVEKLIRQIYYGSTADFVMASLVYQKLADNAYIDRIDSLNSFIKEQMNHEYYVYTCSVDNFNFERVNDLFIEGNYMNKKIHGWLESQLADLESQGELPE